MSPLKQSLSFGMKDDIVDLITRAEFCHNQLRGFRSYGLPSIYRISWSTV